MATGQEGCRHQATGCRQWDKGLRRKAQGIHKWSLGCNKKHQATGIR